MASVTAFLNCLKGQFQQKWGERGKGSGMGQGCGWAHLMARYIGRMAKRGKVCTLIMMVMKAMYSRTLMKPTGEQCAESSRSQGLGGGTGDLVWARGSQAPLTCKQLCVEHVHSLIVPGVFAL